VVPSPRARNRQAAAECLDSIGDTAQPAAAALGEHRRMQPASQLAQLGQRRVQLLDGPAKGGRGGGLGRPRHELQGQCEAGETLLGAAVKVALDPPAGVVGGRDDARVTHCSPRLLPLLGSPGSGDDGSPDLFADSRTVRQHGAETS
jgi:hypothetical protein